MKLLIIISFVFASCGNWVTKVTPQQLHEECNRRLLVYSVIPYRGGHIIKTLDGKVKGWYFTMSKPDSVQEGSWINATKIFIDNKRK